MSDKQIFKVIFHNQGEVYEIYAQNVDHGIMFGFIEVEKLIFGEKTSVVVDPTEEKLKDEFEGVERTYIPMHSIIRIDEVTKEGTAKITETSNNGSNIMPFPVYTKSGDSD
jgi:hypothetical protein